MQERSVIHDTFVIEKKYAASPERVFAAFSDPAQKRRWFLESGGHEVLSYAMDFREDGCEQARIRFKAGTPVAGLECVSDTRYQAIVPCRYMVFANTMDIGGRTISSALVTVEVVPDGEGSEVVVTHQGAFFEGADGPEMRKGGWQALMERLATHLATG
ncbi:MAG: SRPBCC family protein [Candidatus Solibacter sp.]